MPFIRTVRGDIAPEKLGATVLHEHLIGQPMMAGENPTSSSTAKRRRSRNCDFYSFRRPRGRRDVACRLWT